ncbi:EcsC family protein [Salipaludibacillus daqingensis]|uniref:EcsC family protein n=1 Tax=Salipaludibacillus daqingensis TaxID=3041001 RepID=UPI0024731DA6|nr:EcsC family protein [Salipaludibacillus daqingensis]
MELTERERQVSEEISKWELAQFASQGTDFSMTYQKWMNQAIQQLDPILKKRILSILDQTLFHIQASLQQSTFEQRSIENIFVEARIFRYDIDEIADLKKLSIDQVRFIARKHLAKQRVVALGQGGIAGGGGMLMYLSDLPLMLAINLRTVQLLAMIYGNDMRRPYEMMLALKVFHASSLPKHLQGAAWQELLEENHHVQEEAFFYEGEENVIAQSWIQQPLKQILKLLMLRFARKKLIQGIPIAGIAIGAGMNYRFACEVSDVSHMFYQKRWLQEKMERRE